MKKSAKESRQMLVLVLVIIAFFLPIVILLADRNYQLLSVVRLKDSLSTPSVIPTETVKTLDLQFSTDKSTLSPGGNFTVTLDTLPVEDLAVVDITVNFNPDQLTALSVEPGQVWTDQNLIVQEVNNNQGTIRLSFGQAPEESMTNSLTLAEMDFSVNSLASGASAITLDSNSEAAVFNEGTAYRLEAEPLSIQISNGAN